MVETIDKIHSNKCHHISGQLYVESLFLTLPYTHKRVKMCIMT